jgi:2-polyprenyl-3-methyl-5-hydroxy-6-metoxy-1,4-benzoquinol methylase
MRTVAQEAAMPMSSRVGTGAASAYDYDAIPLGYYDEVMRAGHPIRRCWHRQKFDRVLAALPEGPGLSILDIGCAAGTFLSLLPPGRFARQLGVDIIAKQVAWADDRYGAPWRRFRAVRSLKELVAEGQSFDCVTLIEVIEHLDAPTIREVLGQGARLLVPGGCLVLTTPNYASTWPLLERVLNRVSKVTYEEQHLTRFRFPGFGRRLRAIAPELEGVLTLELKATSHFLSPFLGAFSERLAMRASRLRRPERWPFPLGNLILARFRRTDAPMSSAAPARLDAAHAPAHPRVRPGLDRGAGRDPGKGPSS